MSLQPILDALTNSGRKFRRTANGFQAQCPAHEDSTPSLSLTEPHLIYCHAGCTGQAVMDALSLSWAEIMEGTSAPRTSGGGLAAAAARFASKPRELGEWVPAWTPGVPTVPDRLLDMDGEQPDHRWKFRDAAGRLLYGVCRWNTPEGKQVRPLTLWRREGQLGWTLAAPPEPRPLYGLDRLAASDSPVLVVEGEKAADAVSAVFPDHVGIGWHGGAQAARKQDWQPVKDALKAGRDVILWPDADRSGVQVMDWLADELGRYGIRGAQVVEVLPWLSDGWDLADEPPPHVDLQRMLDLAWTPVIWDVGALMGRGEIFRPWDVRYKGPFNP